MRHRITALVLACAASGSILTITAAAAPPRKPAATPAQARPHQQGVDEAQVTLNGPDLELAIPTIWQMGSAPCKGTGEETLIFTLPAADTGKASVASAMPIEPSKLQIHFAPVKADTTQEGLLTDSITAAQAAADEAKQQRTISKPAVAAFGRTPGKTYTVTWSVDDDTAKPKVTVKHVEKHIVLQHNETTFDISYDVSGPAMGKDQAALETAIRKASFLKPAKPATQPSALN